MRYGRLAVNLLVAGACVSLVALEIAGPGNTTSARRPVDTFTHVDVRVDDRGVHVPVHEVAAGEVEVTLTDARTGSKSPLTVISDPHALVLRPGTELTTMRELTTYKLRANAGAHALPGTDSLTVVMPQLGATLEAPGRVTVNIDAAGMNTPYRDERFEAPIAAGSADATSASIPWTTVTPGAATVVLHNHRSTDITCAIANGSSVLVPSGGARSVAVTFVRGDNLIDCGATKLDLEN